MSKLVIALTAGDPGGVGPEVIARTFRRLKGSRRFHYVLFGTPEPLSLLKKRGCAFPLHAVSSRSPLRPDAVNFVDVSAEARRILKKSSGGGKSLGFDRAAVSKRNAAIAYASLKAATRYALSGRAKAVVTAPINKTSMRLVDPHFHGHTEYLAKASRAKAFAMMFVSDRLKVTLVTIHEPIAKVSLLITRRKVLEKIRLTHDFLKRRLRLARPRIAVCALNPHGRETGPEEDRTIAPAVRAARRAGIRAQGPFSADQLFYDAYQGRVDAVISMYHDQGLAPFKMIAFWEGVNVTLGLPFVRTSPDHGTAFDIAYRGKANPASFASALRLAEQLL